MQAVLRTACGCTRIVELRDRPPYLEIPMLDNRPIYLRPSDSVEDYPDYPAGKTRTFQLVDTDLSRNILVYEEALECK